MNISPNSLVIKQLPGASDPAPTADAYDVHKNFLGDRGTIAFLEALKLNPHFSRLNVSDNGIRNQGALAIAEALKSHHRLTALDISNNEISATGGEAIVSLIKGSPNLKTVSFGNNRFDASMRLKIKAAVDDNVRTGSK